MKITSHVSNKYIYVLIVLFSIILIPCLSSCFNNKTPDKSYFSIDYMLATQPKYSQPKYNASLVIQNVSSALA